LPPGTIEELSALQVILNIYRGDKTVKQYLGSSNQERDPQGVTSAQPPQPSSQKTVSNRKAEAQKKTKANKPNEPRERS
jgi:hypothetical protein